ncbi:MAG: DNA-deoxyinosine glycosylase [Spirochaetia bacterium]|nr:DNA-deoxyinosine glycosylase [Spirochaetia bacterium]NCC88725.1 DNA-deoxyinosine glycosylase [Spirochaetia bacterium]
MLSGFPPIESPQSKILILGTGPSVRSLQKQQYYGHEQNAFWPIMAEILGGSIETYEQKYHLLLNHDIALWDVLARFERKGSSDAAYTQAVPNDIKSFLAEHDRIDRVLFNGQKAHLLHRKLIALEIPGLQVCILPSTSPAYTLPYAEKRKRWQEALGM